ncbi:MAG: hypothetical protein CTY29_06240 [Methylobacter sp.]|nr:MAG: hypothetical protein CTY29_06240 [Methylobacter sp.]
MERQVCKYSIVRFQPFAETEEFVNIGVVLYATASKRIEFKLLDSRNHKRVTGFFPELSKTVFIEAAKIMHAEIDRVKHYLDETTGITVDLYAELTRRREDIIRFSDSRVMFCVDPVACVNELFEQTVKRSFVHEPGYEETLKKRVRALLDSRNLGALYKEASIGVADKYEATFPFVRKQGPLRIIKPIHFLQEKPSAQIDHAHYWLSKVAQLDKLNFIEPGQVLFAYDTPYQSQIGIFYPIDEIIAQADKIGVIMANIHKEDEIADFAGG